MDMSGGAAVLEGVARDRRARAARSESAHGACPRPRTCRTGPRPSPATSSPSSNGKTVEVNNTDAEGRLILADALTYCVRELSADRVDRHRDPDRRGRGRARLDLRRADLQRRRLGAAGRRGRRAHRRAGLAPAAASRVQGPDPRQGRRPHQRLGEAQGLVDLRRRPSSRSSWTASPGPTSTSPAPPGTSAATTSASGATGYGVRLLVALARGEARRSDWTSSSQTSSACCATRCGTSPAPRWRRSPRSSTATSASPTRSSGSWASSG